MGLNFAITYRSIYLSRTETEAKISNYFTLKFATRWTSSSSLVSFSSFVARCRKILDQLISKVMNQMSMIKIERIKKTFKMIPRSSVFSGSVSSYKHLPWSINFFYH